MIKSENGEVTIKGSGWDVLVDFSVASAAVTETLLNSGVPKRTAKDVLRKALNVGMKEAFDIKRETMPEMDEIEKAMDELFERFQRCLNKPAQTLIIPTPNGLPGVPTIDNGNYTDASGQQWLCDEVDLKRGVYVQNVAFAEFGKGITSLTKNSGVSSKNIVSAYFFSIPRKRAKTRHTIMSNCLRFVANVSSSNPAYVISNESQTEAMYVSIPAELYENDDQMLNLLAEKKVKILYATYPTERPLSTEELEKYRSLRTYSPTTTVINDAGAGMSVGYKRK